MEYKLLVHHSVSESTYGICLTDGDNAVASIPEIAANKTKIEHLTALLNELSVEPCHFEDVVEDFLTDFKV